MTDEDRSWRKAFEMIGPELLRIKLGRGEYATDYARAAERWLLEQQAAIDLRETVRFVTIRAVFVRLESEKRRDSQGLKNARVYSIDSLWTGGTMPRPYSMDLRERD